MDTAGDPGDPSDTDTTIPKTLIDVNPDETGAVETQNYGENVSSTPLCFRNCRRAYDKRFSQIRCALCARQFHMKCVTEQEPNFDARSAYRCDTCKLFPVNILQHIDALNNAMQEMAIAQQAMHRVISRKLDELATQADESKRENELLRAKVTDMTTQLQQKQWPTHRPQQTVVVGTSLVKHMDENKLQHTRVICLPGAKLQWIAKTVRNLPPDTACNRLVVVAGGNDVADSKELQDAVNDYETVITEAKKRFTSVVISSVPPRLDNEDFTAKIDHFNAQLCKMADDNGCQFTNHHDTFHLASGRINDGYYDRDGVHPNPKATKKMAESLGLISKADSKDTATRDAAKKNHHRQDSADEESTVDTTHPIWQRVNAKVSRRRRSNAPEQEPRLNARRQKNAPSQRRSPQYERSYDKGYNNRQPREEYNNNYRECDYCAETSHSTRDCGFKQPVKCWRCKELGHKAKHCHHFLDY